MSDEPSWPCQQLAEETASFLDLAGVKLNGDQVTTLAAWYSARLETYGLVQYSQSYLPPEVMPVAYAPKQRPDGNLLFLRAEWRGGDQWAVTNGARSVLNREDEFEWEPLPSSRTEDFVEQHRFDLSEALHRLVKLVQKEVTDG